MGMSQATGNFHAIWFRKMVFIEHSMYFWVYFIFRQTHIVQISLKQDHFWPRHGLQKADGGFELRVGGADRQLQGASRKEVLNGFGQTIGDRETELIYLVSRDWFKGKFAGTHGLYHETAGFSGGFSLTPILGWLFPVQTF